MEKVTLAISRALNNLEKKNKIKLLNNVRNEMNNIRKS